MMCMDYLYTSTPNRMSQNVTSVKFNIGANAAGVQAMCSILVIAAAITWWLEGLLLAIM